MAYEIKNDGKFKYIEEGEGEVVILLHGLFGALSNFENLFNHFKGKYKIVIPMLPLYDMPLLTTGVKTLAEFLKKFILHKGYNNVTLLGNSLGGHVALVYVDRWPAKVHSLVLTGSSGLYENAFGGTYPKREDKNFIRERTAQTFYDPKHATDELVDEVFEIINNRSKLIKVLALAKSAIRHNVKDDLHKIKVPTLLIWGKNDIITPPEVADDFNKFISGSELHWIDKCGHAAMMEHPNEFNSILDAWLLKTRGK